MIVIVLESPESCKDVKVEFEEPIMSGTLVCKSHDNARQSLNLPPSFSPNLTSLQELISSKDVTISINPQDALPTVSIENCEGIHLHYYEPRAIGGIYTVECRVIVVHLQPPHQPESVLDLPEDDIGQYVSMLKGGKMVTVQAIRGMCVCVWGGEEGEGKGEKWRRGKRRAACCAHSAFRFVEPF